MFINAESYASIEKVLVIVCIMIILLAMSQFRHNRQRCTCILVAVLAEVICLISDVISLNIGNSPQNSLQVNLLYASSYIYFLTTVIIAGSLASYVFAVIESNGGEVSKYFKVMPIIVGIIIIIGLVLNPFTSCFFYFDANFEEGYGVYLYVELFFYWVLNATMWVSVYKYRKHIPKNEAITLIIYFVILAASVVVSTRVGGDQEVFLLNTIALFLVALANVDGIIRAYQKNKEQIYEMEKQQAEDRIKLLQTELLQKDISMASEIQIGSLPVVFPPYEGAMNFQIDAFIKPAKQVGGDLYDCFQIDENHICIVIADVSGKGIPASLFMMQTRISIHSQAKISLESSKIAERVNDLLCENNNKMMFATAWLGIIDTKEMVLTYTNAGHNAPCFYRRGSAFKFLKKRHGMPFGIEPGQEYGQTEKNLTEGDLLLLYTDGVTEANDVSGGMYGDERLLSVMEELKEEDVPDIMKKLKADIDAFVGEADQFDDITFMCMRVKNTI